MNDWLTDWMADKLLRKVFRNAKSHRPHSLARAMELGLVPPPYLEDAQDILDSYPYPRTPKTAIPTRGWQSDPGPGWDNTVRAYEENR